MDLAPLHPPAAVRLRATLRAESPLTLPGWLGSGLHGAIGHALRGRDGARSFDQSPSYRRWMEHDDRALPAWMGAGHCPALVVRPPRLSAQQRLIREGDSITFELVALRRDPHSLTSLCEALLRLSERDFGAASQRVRLVSLMSGGRELLGDGGLVEMPVATTPQIDEPIDAPLAFETRAPLVLRREGELLREPHVVDLALAAVRRLVALRQAFGDPVAELHLGDLADHLAHDVVVAAQQWRRFRGERWSSRQRRRHRVEGTLGHARFEGPTALLGQVLRWTEPFGLGKGTALGLGGFVVS